MSKMDRRSLITGAVAGGVAGVAGTAAYMGSQPPKVVEKIVEKEVAAPAVVADRVEIAMVATWGRDFPGLGTGAQRFAKSITDLSDGRIQVEYFAANERVGAFDSFDEVASGNAQAYHAADYYWKGKHPGWAYYTAVPFGMTYSEINAWIRFGGGQELWDELASGFGLKCLPCGNTGVQAGGWFNKEINSADDFNGLKMRMPGLGGDVISKVGASPVSLPGGQIYENLVSGAIDATEWVGPWNDEIMKFYEAAKFYYTAGMHEPGSMLAAGFNEKFWSDLSDTDKAIITAAATQENDLMMSEYNAKNGDALARLIKEQGVEVREFNDDVWDALGVAAVEVFEEARAHSDLANRIHESFLKGLNDIGGWFVNSNSKYVAQRQRVLNG